MRSCLQAQGDTCHYQQTYIGHTWYVREAGTGAFLGGFYAQSDATVHIHPWTFGAEAEASIQPHRLVNGGDIAIV